MRRSCLRGGARFLVLCAACATSAEVAHAHGSGACQDDETSVRADMREAASKRVAWKSARYARVKEPIPVQLLGFNDFHGQLSAGKLVSNRPVGGAAVLAAYLEHEQAEFEGTSFIVHAGDHVGASPAASALLQDEPSITFLNMLTNDACARADEDTRNARCNVIGTLGNHEFDEGVTELLRLIRGGVHATGPFLDPHYAGANFPYVNANVVDAVSNQPILPPYVIRRAGKAKLAFIGAVLKQTPTIVTPTGVAGVRFLDEADAINAYIPEIRTQGVEAIVVLIHQGGTQTNYTGNTQADALLTGSEIHDIVSRLDGAVDVVVSGHTHAFSNALLNNAAGKPVLVTQAFSASTAFADIELTLDPQSGDVLSKSASIVTTYADAGPGLTPDSRVAQLVAQAEAKVAPQVNRVVGEAAAALTRTASPSGESALGDLIADAQRAAMATDFAFMNPGGIRADLDAGPITWGELFTVQPFGNTLVKLTLTGEQLYTLLEQQWPASGDPRFLQISGLSYTWDAAQPVGTRVREIRKGDTAIDKAAGYSVTCNNFLATGGDGFTAFTLGTSNQGGPSDVDALTAYVERAQQPLAAAAQVRITRQN